MMTGLSNGKVVPFIPTMSKYTRTLPRTGFPYVYLKIQRNKKHRLKEAINQKTSVYKRNILKTKQNVRRIYLAAMLILKSLSVFIMKGGTESFTENLGRTEAKIKNLHQYIL